MLFVLGVSVAFSMLYALVYSLYIKNDIVEKNAKPHYFAIAGVGVAAMAVHLVCSVVYYGHQTDMTCFSAWSDMVFRDGFGKFYISDSFTDYPPGYMYILYVVGWLRSLGFGGAMTVKLPAMLADIGLGIMAYASVRKSFSEKASVIIAAFIMLSPVLIVNSSLWGQVDIIYTFLLVVAIWFVYKKRLVQSYFMFALAFFVKPQALIFTPILLLATWEYVIKSFKKEVFIKHILGALGAVAMVIVLSIPFGIQETFRQYIITLDSYKYATINAFNVYGAIGLNWKPLTTLVSVVGTLFIVAVVIFIAIMYFKGNKNWFFLAGVLSFAIYMLCTKMHERYAFASVVFFLFAYIMKPQDVSMRMFIISSFSQLVNSAWVLFVYEKDINKYAYSPDVIVFSVINVVLFIYMIFCCIKKSKEKEVKVRDEQTEREVIKFRTRKAVKLTRTDFVLMLSITLVYAVISFINLGNTTAPQSYYNLSENDVTVTFDKPVYVKELAIYPSCNDISDERSIEVSYKYEDGERDSVVYTSQDVFCWNFETFDKTVTELTFSTSHSRIMLMEIGIIGNDGLLQVDSKNQLFDEQYTVPERRSYLNGTYFDEIYHARTGYEFVNGFNVYEWTHPPLGKVFIAAGIKLFGMTPFGWRVIGNIFGILMVPLLYILAKKMFRVSWIAFFTTVIFTFDFMHFVQTRISTIDVYVTFFIMMMYLFMYRYYQMSSYDTPLKKTLVPLLLTGIAFGLGAASKWTAIYACAGIALIYFIKMAERYNEYYCLRNEKLPFLSVFVKSSLFCVLAFIIIPVVIYALSYIPYLSTENTDGIATIINNQRDIFVYHSKTVLNSEHPFSSQWFTWPIMQRPIWYYSGTVSETVKEGISAFGNPLVWWFGIPAFIYNVFLAIVNRDRKSVYLLIGYLSCLLPWMPVERTTYIYHYFPCVPFVVLMIGHCFEHLYYKNVRLAKLSFGVYALGTVLLFALFYPVLSGYGIEVSFVEKFLKWFESWVLI